jgi:hypothetical protein
MRRQACYTESIEWREVKRALFGKYDGNSKIQGTLCISSFFISLIIGNAIQESHARLSAFYTAICGS